MAMPGKGRMGSPKVQSVKQSGTPKQTEAAKSTRIRGTRPAPQRGTKKGAS